MDISIVYYNDNKNKTPLQTASGQDKEGRNKKMMYGNYVREATADEMAIFNRVEAVTHTMTDEEFEHFTEVISDKVFYIITDKSPKAIYQRVYRLGKKYGFTVAELETWYCID